MITLSSVTYEDLLSVDADSQERCSPCNCCSKCQAACTCSASGENEDEVIMGILGIDPDSEIVKKAELFRKRFVEEEMKVESDGGEDDQEGDDGEEGHSSAEKDDVVVGVIQI